MLYSSAERSHHIYLSSEVRTGLSADATTVDAANLEQKACTVGIGSRSRLEIVVSDEEKEGCL